MTNLHQRTFNSPRAPSYPSPTRTNRLPCPWWSHFFYVGRWSGPSPWIPSCVYLLLWVHQLSPNRLGTWPHQSCRIRPFVRSLECVDVKVDVLHFVLSVVSSLTAMISQVVEHDALCLLHEPLMVWIFHLSDDFAVFGDLKYKLFLHGAMTNVGRLIFSIIFIFRILPESFTWQVKIWEIFFCCKSYMVVLSNVLPVINSRCITSSLQNAALEHVEEIAIWILISNCVFIEYDDLDLVAHVTMTISDPDCFTSKGERAKPSQIRSLEPQLQ